LFIESYFETATHLFAQYDLQLPLHIFLKEYFRNNKKFGSRDRKYIAELLYGIYRLGKSNNHLSIRERLLIGSFLSGRLPILFFTKAEPILAKMYELDFENKKEFIIQKYNCNFQLPFELSVGVKEEEFIKNLFSIPRVFIRIRQNKKQVEEALFFHKIEYKKISESCFSFESNIKLHEYLNAQDYVIQDSSSQLTGNFLDPKPHELWWDTCAASGGKSIMVLDKCNSIQLTVSDIRESIIKNLHERMQLYGYGNHYISHTLNLSKDMSSVIKKKFDVILCDVPCSGSGTWARSPEQFYFFTEEKLNEFSAIQKQILKPEGRLYYITCSLFKNENENVIESFYSNKILNSVSSKLIDGSLQGADFMYLNESLLEKS
jgi:16S rRNA (cytosine967-C5)-methyltransferase